MTWLPKAQIESMLVEKLSDRQVWTVNCLNWQKDKNR